MKKVLIINTIGMGYEGISSVIFNYLEHMNKENIELNFAVFKDTKKEIINRISSLGTIHFVSNRRGNLKQYLLDLNSLLKLSFDVIHVHGNSGTMFFETFIAKLNGVKKIMVHCHNTTCDYPIVNEILKRPMKWLATDLISCSKESGKWLYGNSRYIVLNNAIDLQRFKFNQKIREEKRKEYEINDEVVIGHVGSFIDQKNHDFLLDVFNEFYKSNPNSYLLLGSDGPLLNHIKARVSEYGLTNNVIFVGRRKDIDQYYHAMDLFLMPSKWEGLPVVMIEAQANALPTLVSSNITLEAKCLGSTMYLGLDECLSVWASQIEKMLNKVNRDKDVSNDIKSCNFDILEEAQKLREMYLL